MHVAQKGLTEGEVDQVVDWCRDTDNWLTKYVCVCVCVCVCMCACRGGGKGGGRGWRYVCICMCV